MKEIKLKDNSIIYVEEFGANERRGRYKLYDSNSKYIDYLDEENYPTEKEYNGFIDFAQNELIDAETFFDYFCQSYDFDITPQQLLHTYIDNISQGQTPNEFSEDLKKEIKDILFDIEFYTDDELCDIYDINKIGKLYFRGNW